MSVKWLAFALAYSMSTCAAATESDVVAQFARTASGVGNIELRGIARLSGELIIYADRPSFNASSKFPRCVSGIFPDQYRRHLRQFTGKEVIVTGKLFAYADLPYEDRQLVPRRLLAGSVISNFCYGPSVLLLDSIKFAPR